MMNENLKKELPDETYRVTQEGATEAPFTGKYVNHKADGMYHCVTCDTPLFSSNAKFDSGTGWPSFDSPGGRDAILTRPDNSLGMERTEVICKNCGAHLGHLFMDGPKETTGQRYCINSCALDFKSEER